MKSDVTQSLLKPDIADVLITSLLSKLWWFLTLFSVPLKAPLSA